MSEDPTIYLAGKVGELTGVITTFQSSMSDKLDLMSNNINGKIGATECKVIVGEVMNHHVEAHHTKKSIPPVQGSLSVRQKQAIFGTIIAAVSASVTFLISWLKT